MRTRQLLEFGILAILLVDLVGVPLSFGFLGAGIEATQPSSSAPNGRCQWSSATSHIITCAVYPTDDSFVDNLFSSEAMQVYGFRDVSGYIGPMNRVIIVQDTATVPASKNYVFLRFDFSNVLPSAIIGAHAKPLNASLWLYNLYTVAFQNASVRAYNVPNNNWAEDRLTWNNMPQVDQSHFTAQQIALNDRWYSWNITSDVQNITQNSVVSFALMAGFTSPANYAIFASKDNPKTAERPELDISFRDPALNVQSLPTLPVTIDGMQMRTDSTGSLQAFLPWGTHNVSITDSLPVSEGARMIFAKWSDGVTSATRQVSIGNNMTLQANYETQYYLNVTSPYGSVNGSGWYDSRNMATISVNPRAILEPGLLGSLGGKLVFQAWTGDSTASTATANIMMDSPKTVRAQWTTDNSQPYMIVGGIGAAIVGVMIVAFLLIRRKGRPEIQR